MPQPVVAAAQPAAQPAVAAAQPTAAPIPTPVPTPVPGPSAGSSFTPSAEDLSAWQRAAGVLDYNAAAHFGGSELRTGFTPDPWPFPLTAGGGSNPVEVSTLAIKDAMSGAPCSTSTVARAPDFHFTFTAGTTFPLVRFYVVTQNNADATLLINQPDGRWRCNDDHGRDGWSNPLMPAIDFANPASGRYDIWVGTFAGTSNNPATLYVTELDSNHP